jgi:CSLREA domain-containing protein
MRSRALFLRVALVSFLLGGCLTERSFATCPPTCGLAYTVDSTGDGHNVGPVTQCNDGTGHCTLRAAIEAANGHAGDDGIFFNIPTTDPGYNSSTGVFTITLNNALPDLSTNLSVQGPGAGKLTVHANANNSNAFRVFNVTTAGTVSFSDITISGGVLLQNGFGAGIQNANTATINITNCTFSSNQAINGGGAIANVQSANVFISNCVFSQNIAGNPAGNNFGDEPGGAILNQASGVVTITGCTISSNGALGTKGGGGVANFAAGTVNVTNCTLDHNVAGGIPQGIVSNAAAGGGITNHNGGTVTLTGSTLTANSASSGGGAANLSGTFTATDCIFSANTANVQGTGTSNGTGGGIYHGAGTMTVTNCTITGNTVTGLFGGSGAGSGSGGGIFHTGPLTISGSTVSGNSAQGGEAMNGTAGAAFGGGVYSSGSLTAVNCTIAGNSLQGGRGLSGNVGGAASGGGIYFAANGTYTVTSSTIVSNTATGGSGTPTAAGVGGGIFNANGTVNLKSTLIAGNTAQTPDVNGPYASQGFNLIGKTDGSTGFPSGTDLVGTINAPLDPKIDPNGLKNNGGPTLTIALLPGSPAIDHGNSATSNGTPATDQRDAGFPRIYDNPSVANAAGGDGSDIGAFEVQAVPGLVANVSTRLQVGTGDNVLIEGFIVQGPAGSTKKIIVRAIGPSLVAFGITDALPNPTLEIHDANNGNAIVATNDDWKTTQPGGLITADQSAEIAASGVAPGNDLESAIIANLPPGSYTAVVRGVGNSVGTGVVDAYDLSAASPAKLVNVATRGLIQPGDQLMIAGFIVQNGSVRAVVRAIGPSLAAFGITNALADTTLQLRDGNGAIVVENDDWKIRSNGTSQQAELEATGLQPTNDLEAAVVATLPPGQYTAQVRGKPETTGTGVVQVYFLP